MVLFGRNSDSSTRGYVRVNKKPQILMTQETFGVCIVAIPSKHDTHKLLLFHLYDWNTIFKRDFFVKKEQSKNNKKRQTFVRNFVTVPGNLHGAQTSFPSSSTIFGFCWWDFLLIKYIRQPCSILI